jgi:DNA-binding FadR family transcriptional regulator
MTSKDPQTLRPKLAEQVQVQLLARIRDGELRPGDTLPSERELMASLSVGRVTIREAMQSLQRMGLIEIKHGGRPKVRQPTLEQVIRDMGETMRHMLTYSEETFSHFKTARLVFEKEMVRMASLARRPEQIAHLREIICQMDAAKAQREEYRARTDATLSTEYEYDNFMRLDGDFHKTVAAMSGNPVLAALSGALFDWLAHFHMHRARSPGSERLTIDEHVRIVDAIEAGDPDLAVGRTAEHLGRANSLYQQEHLNVSDYL